MNLLSCNSKKGIGKFNNDIMNYDNDFCYVMDGASSLFNDNLFFDTSDLYEYMQLLKKNIVYSESINSSFSNGIIMSNKSLPGYEKYKEYELPTFTIAAVKEENDYYELYLLCDCLISILYKDGNIENIEDHRFDETKNNCRKEISVIDELNLTREEKLELKRPIWRKYRKFANREDGYPVGSTNPSSINEGIIKRVNKEEIDKIIICSDGLYSKLGLPNNIDYFDKDILEKKVKDIDNNDDLTYILIENK